MVIKGKARGGHRQLVQYMMGQGENESVRLLHIAGTMDTKDPYKAMQEFGYSQELSGSQKAFYHGQLSPAYEESMRLTDEQYIDMVYRVSKHLGYDKPRVIVTEHVKNGHKHIHFGIDRYDYTKGRLVSDSYNYYKHDKARAEIEQAYNLVRTPQRNQNKDQQRLDAADAWATSRTGQDFVFAMKKKGYTLAVSVKESRPFRLIDGAGRNYNLVREIKGVKTADVREMLKDVKLPLDTDILKTVQKQRTTKAKAEAVKQEAEQVTAKKQKTREEEFLEKFLSKGKNKDRSRER